MTENPINASIQSQKTWIVRVLFLTVVSLILIATSVLFWKACVQPTIMWWESMSWAEVPCKIDSAVVRLDPKTKAAAYLPDVRYRYQWNDRTYHGTRFAWDTSSYSRKSSIEKWIEPFPAGKETVCFVNPNQPEEAVLLRSFPKPTLLVNTVIFFFIAVGFEVMGTLLIGLLPPWKKP